MAEALVIAESSEKDDKYKTLIPQIESLIAEEKNRTANLANVAAAIHETFRFFWTGFYVVEGGKLVLGPFQGPVACTRIAYGKGVCGTAWKNKSTLIVPDVLQFPGHIACNSLSRSEIVVPVLQNNEVVAVLDIDSKAHNLFDQTDQQYLEDIANLISRYVSFG